MNLIAYKKKIFRKRVIKIRNKLPLANRRRLSRVIMKKIITSRPFVSASCIAGYISTGSEVDTEILLKYIIESGKILILPRVSAGSRQLLFYRVENLCLDTVEGYRGIIEPVPEKCSLVPLSNARMILVPGVVFSESCDRIGYGGGFYDVNLKKSHPCAHKIGVGFDFQIHPNIPASPQDHSVNAVITERCSYGSVV